MASPRQIEKALQHAAKRLVLAPGAKPAEILGPYKKFLKVEDHRLKMFHRAGAGGRELANARAEMMDIVLRHLFTAADQHHRQNHPGAPVPLALVAIGGYGRAELSPFSDIDIMFLHDAPGRKQHPYITSVVEQVLYMLWDIGLKVGHSTRTLREACAEANKDMQSKTSLIESRLLLGDRPIYDVFRQALVKNCVRGYEKEYIAERMADQKSRHEKHGDTVYLQEPNVKNSCGGLRDFQNLIWMAYFKHGVLSLADLRKQGVLARAEQRQLDDAYEFILRTRNALHYLSNRANDVIHLNLQPKLADEFGYRQHDLLRRTEAFMRDYYTHSRTIFLLTTTLAERLALRPKATGLFSRHRKSESFDGFIQRDGVIEAGSPGVFRDDPLRLLRVFHYAQLRQVEFHPDLQTLIRANLQLVNRSFQLSAGARETFLAILQRKGQVARVLRGMHETGFLGKFIPEFGQLTCLVQHEFFHRYTADEHTLQVIEHLDRIIDAANPPHASYKKIFQQVEHPHVLYLAILLHDVGKAANVDRHAEASLVASRAVARRFKLDADQTGLLEFLVRDQHKLSMLSQRRDIDDQATIDAAVRIVKDEIRLDLLVLLTFADSIGVGAQAWSDWKEALLWNLYHRTKQELAGTERARHILARRIEQLYQEVSRRLKGTLSLEEIYSHFELMPASYYINTSADEIARHLLLLHQFFQRQHDVEAPEEALTPVIAWETFPAQGFSRVSIGTWDRLGLFSKICGAFASAGLNVLSAHIYTRGDQVVLDHFEVCDRDLAAVTDDRAVKTTESLLERTLTGREQIDFHAVLAKMRATRLAVPHIREVTIPTTVEFDNEISQSRTVVEVQTENRHGLLFTITNTLAELGLDISFAKISTEKGAAIDSFYVQDQQGQKITDPDRLADIASKLQSAIELLAS
jgi:[protein-PII] uridylyltransferase